MPAATAPISRSTVKARLDDFSHHWRQRIDQWRADGQSHTEKSAAQQFWSDLFRCFGIIPERIDLFERDAARDLHPKRSLAEHYNPLVMDPALVKTHDALDREVDKAFGANRKLTTERQSQELLFANYLRMTSGSDV